jgi:hypothetical protein
MKAVGIILINKIGLAFCETYFVLVSYLLFLASRKLRSL